jgi:hypothetical protein
MTSTTREVLFRVQERLKYGANKNYSSRSSWGVKPVVGTACEDNLTAWSGDDASGVNQRITPCKRTTVEQISCPNRRTYAKYGSSSLTKMDRNNIVTNPLHQQGTLEVVWIVKQNRSVIHRPISTIINISHPCNRPWRPIGLWEVEAPTFSRQSAHGWWWGCQPYAPAALYPQEDSWYSFLLEAESIPGL